MFLSTLSVMLPTFNEVLFDYNPYYHASKFCIGCTANVMQRGFGVVQKVTIIWPLSLGTLNWCIRWRHFIKATFQLDRLCPLYLNGKLYSTQLKIPWVIVLLIWRQGYLALKLQRFIQLSATMKILKWKKRQGMYKLYTSIPILDTLLFLNILT